MADLPRLRQFAAEHDFGMTAPLTAAQVRTLASYWLPDLHFHEDERFHPIALADVFDLVERHLDELPPEAREQWKVGVRERGETNGEPAAVVVAHDPPVLFRRDGSLPVPGPKVYRTLVEGSAVRDALGDPEIDEKVFLSNGASAAYANEHFGSTDLLFGGNTATPGNPWLPRADERAPGGSADDRRPRMTVLAQYVNLVDVLRYELLIAAADATDEPYPPDGMRRAFDIGAGLVRHDPHTDPSDPPLRHAEIEKLRRDLLLAFVDAERNGTPDPALPPGWTFDAKAWRVVTDHAFLEYTFF
ncbi:MAG: hypothetical protein EOO67_07335 [Microbacterium sp.]|nr:MAG: hypothetical protein EOO67_07335 [Microbacterium sp.]